MQEGRKANGECSRTRTILEGSMQTATSGKRMMLAALALALGLCLPGLAVAGEVVEYFHLDAVGNIRAVTDASGNVIERHDYLPFGDEWCGAGVCGAPTAGQPRRFTGKERDRETGFDYFGARYYSGRVGRFTGVDPVYTWRENLVDPQRWNRYAYGLNKPYRYVDPDGRQAVEQPSTLDQLWYELNRHVRLNQVPNFNYQQGAAATPVAVDKDTVKKAAIVVGAAATAAAIAASLEGSPAEDGPTDFDSARRQGFEHAGLTDDPSQVEFSEVDAATGTVVEFKGPRGAEVGYDGPHPGPGPHHDVPHVSAQTDGKRRDGGRARKNFPYSGPRHPSRKRK